MVGGYTRVLDLRPEYAECDTGRTVQVRALAKTVARRLSAVEPQPGAGNAPYLNHHQTALVSQFIDMSRNRVLTVDEFNVKMSELYKWANSPVGAFGLQRVCQVVLQDEF